MNKKIIVIAGTNRPQALTKSIAAYYQNLLNTHQTESQLMDLSGLPHDFVYSALYQNTGKNEIFNQYQKAIDQSEKIVFIIPEYNGSFPGILKTFLDGLRYPDTFHGKKVALVGLSAGIQGGVLALSHWTDIMSYLGADVLGMRIKLHQIHQHFKGDKFTFSLFEDLLKQQVEKFLKF